MKCLGLKERKHECEKQKNHSLLLNKTIIVLFNLRTRRAFDFTAANKTKKNDQVLSCLRHIKVPTSNVRKDF